MHQPETSTTKGDANKNVSSSNEVRTKKKSAIAEMPATTTPEIAGKPVTAGTSNDTNISNRHNRHNMDASNSK